MDSACHAEGRGFEPVAPAIKSIASMSCLWLLYAAALRKRVAPTRHSPAYGFCLACCEFRGSFYFCIEWLVIVRAASKLCPEIGEFEQRRLFGLVCRASQTSTLC